MDNNDTFSKALEGNDEAARSVTDKLRFSKGWRIQAAAPKMYELLGALLGHADCNFIGGGDYECVWCGCISRSANCSADNCPGPQARALIQMIEGDNDEKTTE